MVNGLGCTALIDSGSQVTTITNSFYCSHPVLRKQKPQPSTVPIEGAGGHTVPYSGFINIDLKVLGKVFSSVPTFVVPDSEYR